MMVVRCWRTNAYDVAMRSLRLRKTQSQQEVSTRIQSGAQFTQLGSRNVTNGNPCGKSGMTAQKIPIKFYVERHLAGFSKHKCSKHRASARVRQPF